MPLAQPKQGQIILSCLNYKETMLKDGEWKNQGITSKIKMATGWHQNHGSMVAWCGLD